jgi:hypothetical protein
MTAETITPERVQTLAIILKLSAVGIADLMADIHTGDVSPEDAAYQIAETIRNINAAAS